jgi:phage baseplate assembly protein gpV
VIVTEGPIKAEVIAQFTNSAVVAVAGVSSFKSSIGVALKNIGVRQVRIAFDADWVSKSEVRVALERLGGLLQKAGLTVTRLDWSKNQGKGLDDVLLTEVA